MKLPHLRPRLFRTLLLAGWAVLGLCALSWAIFDSWWVGACVGLASSAFVAWWLASRFAQPWEELAAQAGELRRSGFERALASGELEESFAITQALDDAVDRLQSAAQSAATRRAELDSLMSSMAEGVLALDREERVLLMNRSAARMLGLKQELSPGQHWWEDLRFPELERALRASLGGAGPAAFDARPPLGDGSLLSISVNALISAGERNGAVVVLSDVTAMRQLEQMRIDFVANVSHELRTPLSIVLGALETIGDSGTDAAARERFLEIAGRNARRLHAIVTDLLDLSTIESQGSSMPLEELPLERPIRAAAAALQGAAELKGVRLELDPKLRGSEHRIQGNAQRLEQVFTNLIENAIKYTPSGGEVRVRLVEHAEHFEVEVRDSGIGIPREHLHRIFERFYRVDRARSRDMGGTGLGLAIVKHVVKAHGGQVEAESTEGSGTTFRVEFPRPSK